MRLYVQGFPVIYNYSTILNGYNLWYDHNWGFLPGEVVTCRITAEDMGGNWLDYSWNFTIANYMIVDIPVQVGWNLISFPVDPANTALPVVLQDLGGDTYWDLIQWYDPLDTSDHWKTYATYKPPQLNDLTNVYRWMSVWLNIPDVASLGDGYITINGTEPLPITIPLYAGWNLVGYPTLTSMTIMNALAGTGYDAVEGFDPAGPYNTQSLNDTYVMTTFEGYWVHVPADTTWTVDW
jgi:hypothetical protein